MTRCSSALSVSAACTSVPLCAALIERESARRLARLGGAERSLAAPRRRRSAVRGRSRACRPTLAPTSVSDSPGRTTIACGGAGLTAPAARVKRMFPRRLPASPPSTRTIGRDAAARVASPASEAATSASVPGSGTCCGLTRRRTAAPTAMLPSLWYLLMSQQNSRRSPAAGAGPEKLLPSRKYLPRSFRRALRTGT